MQPRHRSAIGGDPARHVQHGLLGLAVLVFGLWLTTADVQAESLGDVAAREAARRAAIATPSRFYTNMPLTPSSAQLSVQTSVVTSPPAFIPDQSSATMSSRRSLRVSQASGGGKGSRSIATRIGLSIGPPPRTAEMTSAGASPVQAASSASLARWSAFQIRNTPASQSLGDLAAREEARRATIMTPSRVYPNVPLTNYEKSAAPSNPGRNVVALRLPSIEPKATGPPVVPATRIAQAGIQKSVLASPLPAWRIAAFGPTVDFHHTLLAVIPDQNAATLKGSPYIPEQNAAALKGSPYIATPAGLSLEPAPHAAAVTYAGASSVAHTAPSASLAGWSPFQIKKTQAELTENARLDNDTQYADRTGPNDVKLPPQRDVLRMTTGIGYLQGTDFGGDISASGRINGMQTDVSTFLTAGPMGFQSRSGHASILTPDGRWRGEGGDLYSDLRGLARGARASWSAGQKWTPSVSLYLPHRQGTSSVATVLAYRDRLQLLPHVHVGGELTSDGAAFLQGQYGHPRLDLTAFYRFTRGPIAGRDKGVSGGLNLGRGVALSGAIRLSDAVGDSRQWQLASVRLPLARQASVTLERSWWTGSSDDGSTNAVTLQLPLGPVQFTQRLQWGRTDFRQRAVPFGFDRRQSQSNASYTPGPWGSLSYQQATQWFEDGRVQQWDEMASIFHIGRRTSLQFVTAFPDLRDPQRLRARVTRQLSQTLALEGQYGRLSAFQLTRAPEREQSRVMVTIRKTWGLTSPSRGGDVRGRAIDQTGHPVSGALVRLGPYSMITDAAGDYAFTRVPDGEFTLALDKNKLPVSYAWDEEPRALIVTGSSRVNADLEVIPLNAIRGRVYIDRNGNGRFDENEGVPNIVVAVDERVTATTMTGSYAFYNQPPGRYIIRLVVPRLAKGLAPASPAELLVELTGDQPLVGVDFTIKKVDMPIIMREIPR